MIYWKCYKFSSIQQKFQTFRRPQEQKMSIWSSDLNHHPNMYWRNSHFNFDRKFELRSLLSYYNCILCPIVRYIYWSWFMVSVMALIKRVTVGKKNVGRFRHFGWQSTLLHFPTFLSNLVSKYSNSNLRRVKSVSVDELHACIWKSYNFDVEMFEFSVPIKRLKLACMHARIRVLKTELLVRE